MSDVPRITTDELKERMQQGEDFTFVDVRNPQAWTESDVMLPGAIRVRLSNLEEDLPRIPRNEPIVTYCT